MVNAREAALHPYATRLRAIGRELAMIGLVAIVLFAARSSLADHYVIPSGSMEHTIQVGDHVFVDKLAYGPRVPFTGWRLAEGERPERGEIVVFDSPEDGTRLIKRVVAVGGDRVSLRGGALRINGQNVRATGLPATESWGDHVGLLNLAHGGGMDIRPTTIPEGRLLVIGDARGNSRDGRYFGLISEDAPYGRAEGIIYRRGEGIVWKGL